MANYVGNRKNYKYMLLNKFYQYLISQHFSLITFQKAIPLSKMYKKNNYNTLAIVRIDMCRNKL